MKLKLNQAQIQYLNENEIRICETIEEEVYESDLRIVLNDLL